MPPRISPRHVQQPLVCQCFRTRPQSAPTQSRVDFNPSRQFHASSPNATRLRRDMFAWLKGPGKAFRKPLPGSSNYLSAYDRQGNLIRKGREERDDPGRFADLGEDEAVLQARDRQAKLSEEEVQIRASERKTRRAELKEMEDRDGLPKEGARDLKPYPLNAQFKSQPVLSEALRKAINELVTENGIDLKAVSAAFGIDVRRVAAVVRLMEVEKSWVQEGKPLAKAYNDAVLAMLPTTPYRPSKPPAHEPINDLPVHPWTRQQIFLPTSESRVFTRTDAAKTFHPSLLPADERIAHPELVQIAKWEHEGHDRETRQRLMREKDTESVARKEMKEYKRKQWERRTQITVPGRRWDFKFQDISAEKVNKDGRGHEAVGIRYGMPHEDRKKGQFKIPTKVE